VAVEALCVLVAGVMAKNRELERKILYFTGEIASI
jgi:hypothetical protein